jgi:hypothetical protein
MIEATIEILEQRINDLEAEVQALRQQLHGAAVLDKDLAAAGKGGCSCLSQDSLSYCRTMCSSSAGGLLQRQLYHTLSCWRVCLLAALLHLAPNIPFTFAS